MLRRHGDQEYMHLVWTEHHPHLRVVAGGVLLSGRAGEIRHGILGVAVPPHARVGGLPMQSGARPRIQRECVPVSAPFGRARAVAN